MRCCAEVVAQAGRILEQDPETVARWQREVAASDPTAAPVKGQVLQESAYGDAHAAVEATQRFNDAQAELKAHIENGGKAEDAPPELKQRLAEATTDLASLKAQLQTSATAHTAYGTAAARIMNQRKSAVSARSAFQLAQQGKQLAQRRAQPPRQRGRRPRRAPSTAARPASSAPPGTALPSPSPRRARPERPTSRTDWLVSSSRPSRVASGHGPGAALRRNGPRDQPPTARRP